MRSLTNSTMILRKRARILSMLRTPPHDTSELHYTCKQALRLLSHLLIGSVIGRRRRVAHKSVSDTAPTVTAAVSYVEPDTHLGKSDLARLREGD